MRDFLKDYKGYIQSDGYSGYNALGEIDGISLCGCWAHARRKFVDVVKADKTSKKSGKMRDADIALKHIRKLYAIEKEPKNLTVEERFQAPVRTHSRQCNTVFFGRICEIKQTRALYIYALPVEKNSSY